MSNCFWHQIPSASRKTRQQAFRCRKKLSHKWVQLHMDDTISKNSWGPRKVRRKNNSNSITRSWASQANVWETLVGWKPGVAASWAAKNLAWFCGAAVSLQVHAHTLTSSLLLTAELIVNWPLINHFWDICFQKYQRKNFFNLFGREQNGIKSDLFRIGVFKQSF